jgi:glycerophosphoryl diester phosphodiesterase
MEVHVELKVEDLSPTGLEAAVAEVLTRQGPDRRVIVSCFHPVGLWRLRRHAPHLPRALLFGTEQRWIWRHGWQGLGLRLSALHPEHGLVTPAAVARWHRRGLRVRAWTVDDPVRVRALAQAGADAIITNEPAAARRALERAGPAMP